MAQLVRVKQGSVFAGVCTGLAARGNASADTWRVVFVISTLFVWIPLFVYIGMALALPQVASAGDAKRKGRLSYGGGTAPDDATKKSQATIEDRAPLPEAGAIEAELERLKKMRSEDLIDEDEYRQLRKKVLGL